MKASSHGYVCSSRRIQILQNMQTETMLAISLSVCRPNDSIDKTRSFASVPPLMRFLIGIGMVAPTPSYAVALSKDPKVMTRRQRTSRSLRKYKKTTNYEGDQPTFGHLFFKPSAHFPYRTSDNCFVCAMPGVIWPGKLVCFSVHTSSGCIKEDWRRR